MTTVLDMESDTAQRAWLVAYCWKLCGDPSVADDLAQETLLAAWQQGAAGPADVAPRAWLAGIAQNMFRRWARQRQRDTLRLLPLADVDAFMAADATEIALERHELAELLGRALGLLPATTRAALIAHYLEDQPHAQIARHLGVSEGAVAVRLHRGRLALQRLLAAEVTDLLPRAAEQVGWEATALWCPYCGARHLEGRFDAAHQQLRLRCGCSGEVMNHGVAVGGAKTYGAAINRINRWLASYYLPAAANGEAVCFGCGQTVTMHVSEPNTFPPNADPSLVGECPCGVGNSCNVTYLALLHDAGQQFMRDQRRIRLENLSTVEGSEGPMGLITFASVTSAARLTARYDRHTLHILP